MAWQLIYTSASRLLDAGRTGFGTVARHRAVSGILASAIERFSQFARQPGHDPKRVIYSHRILTVGTGQYHVLSCIRDAGSDYTGRTSHIAHHVIAEVREIRSLVAEGITPTDVLLAMNWRNVWNENPRFLDPTEEISLLSLRAPASDAWQEATGSQSYARLPHSPNASRGCFLIVPPQVDALKLVHESLQEDKTSAWETTFTTCLEPGDEIGDFRWMGVSASSPQRPQPESATRFIIDLTLPGELPTPPPVKSAKPVPIEVTQREEATPAGISAENRKPSETSPQEVTSATPASWAPEPLAKPQRKSPLLLLSVIAMLVIVTAGAAIFWQFKQKREELGKRQQLEQEVDSLWADYHLKLTETAKWLKDQSNPKLIEEHRQVLKAMRSNLAHPKPVNELPLPTTSDPDDQINALIRDYQAWGDSYAQTLLPEAWSSQSPVDMVHESKPKLDAEKRAWQKLNDHFEKPWDPPSAPELALIPQVKKALDPHSKPKGNPTEWQALLQSLKAEHQAPAWLNHWARADKLKNSDPLMLAEALEKDAMGGPEWLTQMIASKKEQIIASAGKNVVPAATPPPLTPAAKIVLSAESADDPKGTHPIYLVTFKSSDNLNTVLANIPVLPVAESMKIFFAVQTQGLKNLQEWPRNTTQSKGNETVFSLGRMDPKDRQIVFTENRLTRLPESKQNSRLIARTHDEQRLLFEIRLLVSTPEFLVELSSVPIMQLTQVENSLRLEGMKTLLQRIHLAGISAPQYKIRMNEVGPNQKQYFLKSDASGEYHLDIAPAVVPVDTAAVNRLKQKKTELEEGIQSTIRARDSLSGNLAGREQKVNELEIKIAEKKADLEQVTQELNAGSTAKNQAPKITIQPGGYTLMEVSVSPRDLCKIEIQSLPSPQNPAPSNP